MLIGRVDGNTGDDDDDEEYAEDDADDGVSNTRGM
jgi:hypothetical protein